MSKILSEYVKKSNILPGYKKNIYPLIVATPKKGCGSKSIKFTVETTKAKLQCQKWCLDIYKWT